MKKCYLPSLITVIIIYSFSCVVHREDTAYFADSPWPTFQHDMKHSGRSPYTGPENPSLKWKFETGAAIHTPPSIGKDGTIYTGSDDHCLYAINPDGTEEWRFEAEKRIRTCPVLSLNGTIYVGSRDDFLYAVNPDGTMKWKFKTDS